MMPLGINSPCSPNTHVQMVSHQSKHNTLANTAVPSFAYHRQCVGGRTEVVGDTEQRSNKVCGCETRSTLKHDQAYLNIQPEYEKNTRDSARATPLYTTIAPGSTDRDLFTHAGNGTDRLRNALCGRSKSTAMNWL